MNYALSGLVGFEMKNKTVGIYGTGAIGLAAAKIFHVSNCTDISYLSIEINGEIIVQH